MKRSMFLIVAMLATSLFVQIGQTQEPGTAPPQLKVFPLKIISARVVADKLATRFGSVARITFDAPTETVFIQANAKTIQLAEKMADRLEDKCRRNRGEGITVVYLKHADVTHTADVLRVILAAFAVLHDDWEWCQVSIVPRVNAFVISASAEKTQQLRSLLRELDVKANGGR